MRYLTEPLRGVDDLHSPQLSRLRFIYPAEVGATATPSYHPENRTVRQLYLPEGQFRILDAFDDRTMWPRLIASAAIREPFS